MNALLGLTPSCECAAYFGRCTAPLPWSPRGWRRHRSNPIRKTETFSINLNSFTSSKPSSMSTSSLAAVFPPLQCAAQWPASRTCAVSQGGGFDSVAWHERSRWRVGGGGRGLVLLYESIFQAGGAHERLVQLQRAPGGVNACLTHAPAAGEHRYAHCALLLEAVRGIMSVASKLECGTWAAERSAPVGGEHGTHQPAGRRINRRHLFAT